MAFKLVSGWPEEDVHEGTVTAGVAIAKGDALDVSGNVLQRATSSSTIHTIFGVADETISTTATKIKYIPIIPFSQIWEADTTNNSASTQRYEQMVFTDHDTINNTDTTVTGPTGIFTMIDAKGAASDKKILGFFTRLGPTST
ncbi:MAG: hypothetical protein WC346_17055 [Methanogenium sp.]|jgi:hypothetical protein